MNKERKIELSISEYEEDLLEEHFEGYWEAVKDICRISCEFKNIDLIKLLNPDQCTENQVQGINIAKVSHNIKFILGEVEEEYSEGEEE